MIKNLFTAHMLANIEECEDYSCVLKKIKDDLRSKNINPANKVVRKKFRAKLIEMGIDPSQHDTIIETAMGKLIAKEEKEGKKEKTVKEEGPSKKSKDFPNSKGQEYKKIRDRVVTYIKENFSGKQVSGDKIQDMVSEALDKTEYRYLGKHVEDLATDLLKKLKTTQVYVIEPEKGE